MTFHSEDERGRRSRNVCGLRIRVSGVDPGRRGCDSPSSKNTTARVYFSPVTVLAIFYAQNAFVAPLLGELTALP